MLSAGCGGDERDSAAPTTPDPNGIVLREQNDSGESGTATVTGLPKRAHVVITLTGASSTPQPAHIHVGTCEQLGPPVYKLTDVVDGESETKLESAELLDLAEDYAINVHESYDDVDTFVACGELPN